MDDKQSSALVKMQNILNSSSLNDEDKKLLSDRIQFLPDNIINTLIENYGEDTATLDLLIKSLKMKLDAQEDPGKIQQVIDWEQEQFNKALDSA